MTVLSVNGFNAGALIGAGQNPKEARRDVGAAEAASDGTWRVTRQTRKRDLSFKGVPLTVADAQAWESLLIGEGEVWSFDSSLYGSKGTPGVTAGTVSLNATTPKYGANSLLVDGSAGTSSITFTNALLNVFGANAGWSISLWRNPGTWIHYLVRSDGAKWADGARDDLALTTWLTTPGNDAKIQETSLSVKYDDVIVFPFKVLDAWPVLIDGRATAYPPLPFLDLTGDLVLEQTARRVIGQVEGEVQKVAGGQRVVLDVELKAR